MRRRGNGEGNFRMHHDGRLEWRYSMNGKRHSLMQLTGEAKEAFQMRVRALQHAFDRGITTPRDRRQTLGEYLDQWLVTKKPTVELSYWQRCEESFRLYVKPSLGNTPLTKLTAQQVQQLYASVLTLGKAPSTVGKIHTALHKALEDALRMDLVARNVADLVSRPKVPHLDLSTLKPEEAQKLLAAASDDRLEALFVLMLTTACRLGELLGLRWSSLDLDRREMRITAAMKEISGHMALGTPKTPHSRRTIPLTTLAVEALRRHHLAQTVERVQHTAGWNPDGLVFCTTAGTPISRNNFRLRDYTRLLKKAGLPYTRPHNLRHTAATLLFLEGVQPLVVSEMLGHASATFTMGVYGHVQAEMREKARDTMERLFGNAHEA